MWMAESEVAAAILPQEEEKEEDPEEKNVDPVMKSSDPQQDREDKPVENGPDDEGTAAESEGAEQLVVLEEDGDREHLGPRDEIKVTVTGYQRTADSCTFDIEVYM